MCDTDLDDENLAEKFKSEFNEQFHILVRMHLSFILDLNTDENECLTEKGKLKKWKVENLVPFNKKSKSRGVMDGAPLTQEGICQVYQLIEFLKQEQNIKTEGVFRRTGSLTRQQELRQLLNQGITLELSGGTYSVHDCASVLKGFLAELPDPLLTEAHYPAYCQIAELSNTLDKPAQQEKLLTALQLILLLLPTENKVLLKDILNLLNLTASYVDNNRMSSDNLATLFTPHLLCPRKLSPEQLHVNSQNLCGIVAFMIECTGELFKIPKKLLVDFRAKYEKRKYLSESRLLNESVSDQFAANTVFTFVDHERTAKENEANTTETALAQLYAHIQAMPESSKKRKLVKQFNKENGNGTPLQVVKSAVSMKNRSLGDSIKKHIFQKGLIKNSKKTAEWRSSGGEMLDTPQQNIMTRTRLFCTNCDTSNDEIETKKSKLINDNLTILTPNNDKSMQNTTVNCPYLTSTPACLPLRKSDIVFTPNDQERKSMSPITRSTQRMSRAMQETMMTPRSRKPVLLVSGTHMNTLTKVEPKAMEDVTEEMDEMPKNDGSLTETFRDYLSARSMITSTSSPAVDSSFSSRTDDFKSEDIDNLSDDKLTDSLLYCLDGNEPNDDVDDEMEEKQPVLKPKQYDCKGQPIVFETSF